LVLFVEIEAEWVTDWVEEYSNVALGLIVRLLGTELERVRNRCLQVADLKVKMHHHLLRTLDHRPDRTHKTR